MIIQAVGVGGRSTIIDRAINYPSMRLFDTNTEHAFAWGRDR